MSPTKRVWEGNSAGCQPPPDFVFHIVTAHVLRAPGHIYTYRQQRERWEAASVGSRENRVSFVACTRGMLSRRGEESGSDPNLSGWCRAVIHRGQEAWSQDLGGRASFRRPPEPALVVLYWMVLDHVYGSYGFICDE